MINIDKWKFVNRDSERILKMACPECGQWADLTDHSAHEGGMITPSVDCPECSFHNMVILKGFPHTPYEGDVAEIRIT